ncbi:poly-gamma-glutamate synthesis protein (capsule biosynthesis protein) [Allocatelliglobosispora scoriae]|uniref:Poly-gamma-glutamate synthesis protein (Capsule biosynthesis protein) n=1 Tax=Allocatelliglobosispora scoriae TaxID=643052 RepID=A0A841BV59_9ACTN|nr:CapA family protein [Allocatelliglobosispora scoriae]MBB5871049.1 poly-gamma-glutamate synthesis protein (capsule biosynthesis protein) [Allocatelliglobosispora scoriae]
MEIQQLGRLGTAITIIAVGLAAAVSPFDRGGGHLNTGLPHRVVAQQATPPPSPPRSISLIAAGDVLLHQGLWNQAQVDGRGRGLDFRPLFAAVKSVISAADLAICHLETPLGAPGGPFTGFPTFKVPPQVVPALADLGFDTCSTASNHILDGGRAGIKRTLDALDGAGIAHAGSARDPAEAAKINFMTIHGVRVAQLSYAYGFNGVPRPKGKPWVANLLSAPAILAEARRARLGGAEIIIVSLHWGDEYQHEPGTQQRTVAKALLASPDVDLIVGHHAHVVQPFERIGRKWVAYGMGNFVSTQRQLAATRDGVLARFSFTEVAPGRFEVTQAVALPIYMSLDSGPRRVLLVADCAHRGGHVAECVASGRRTAGVVRSRGANPQVVV